MPDDKSLLSTSPQKDSVLEEFQAWLKTNQSRALQGVLFRGVVIDNVDPKEQGRVKVMIDALTPKITTALAAKWAWTSNTYGGGQRDNGQKRYGACSPLPIGSKVWIAFEQSDSKFESPVVIGGLYQRGRIPTQIFDRKYAGQHIPRAWGGVSPKGHSILMREEDEEEAIEIITFKNRRIILSDKVNEEQITIQGAKGGEMQIFEGASGHVITIMDPGGNAITIEQTPGLIKVQATQIIEMMAPIIDLKGMVLCNGTPIC